MYFIQKVKLWMEWYITNVIKSTGKVYKRIFIYLRWERLFKEHKVIWVTFSKCLQDNYWCIINYISNQDFHEKFHLHLTITASSRFWSGHRSIWVPATGPEQGSWDRSAEILQLYSLADWWPQVFVGQESCRTVPHDILGVFSRLMVPFICWKGRRVH